MEGLGDNETLKAAVSKTLGMWSASDAGRAERQAHPSLRIIRSLFLLSRGICVGVRVARGGKMFEWAGEEEMGGKERRGER